MLQQIIQSMYIEPELLNELSDEQKAILFVKIREEQVRRWKEREESETSERKKPKKPPKPGKKHVDFMKGKDGNDWVWVMGEHKNDKTIEQILEEEAQAKAIQEAEREARLLREEEERKLLQQQEAERLRIEKEKVEKEAELRKKEEEAALYASLKEARLVAEKLEQERKKTEEENRAYIEHLRKKFNAEKRKSFEKVEENVHRRSSELYIRWKEMRQMMEKQAEESSKEVEENWKQQEKKAKLAQNQLKELARHARLEHKESIRRTRGIINALSAFSSNKSKEEKPPLPPKNIAKIRDSLKKKKAPRPPRPPNREAVIEWFKEEEKDQGAGKDPVTGKIAPWFHGVISRLDAENILIKKPVGSFLVRVSERVWGYTISYRTEDRCKHFLIDRSDEGYQFFGTDQVQHQSLVELVNFHMNNPITQAGQEKLQTPCGQATDPPDYWPLFNKMTESTDL